MRKPSRFLAPAALIFSTLAPWALVSCGGGGGDVTITEPGVPGTVPSPVVSPSPVASPVASPVPTPAPTRIVINITQIFGPIKIIVKQDTVIKIAFIVIVNNTNQSHSMVADDGSFNSGVIFPGGSVTVRIGSTGVFPFHCGVHPDAANERGVVEILAADEPLPPSPSPSPTFSPSPSPTFSPSPSPTFSPSPSPTFSPSPSPTFSPSPSPTFSPSPSPEPSPSISPEPSPSISPEPSPSISPEPSPSISPEPSPSISPEPSPSISPEPSPSPESPSPVPVESPAGTIIITAGASTRTSDAFAPGPVVVQQNDTVTVINQDTVDHTATANDGSFDTGVIEPGESETFTASTAGDIGFHCTIHPGMTGVLSVIPSAEPSPEPAASPDNTGNVPGGSEGPGGGNGGGGGNGESE